MGFLEMRQAVLSALWAPRRLVPIVFGVPVLFGFLLAGNAPAYAQCERVAFENAVDEAAASLRDLNSKNRPQFQNKLRQLKAARGWSDDQFMAEAAPFVRDEQTAEYDDKTAELLGRITSMGQEGSEAAEPDCALLEELRGLMFSLIETQVAKWAHMFGKLDAALGVQSTWE